MYVFLCVERIGDYLDVIDFVVSLIYFFYFKGFFEILRFWWYLLDFDYFGAATHTILETTFETEDVVCYVELVDYALVECVFALD